MLVNIANLFKIVLYESDEIHQCRFSEPAPGTPTFMTGGMGVVVCISSNLSGGVPGTVGVVEVVSEGILSGSLSLLSSEELVAGSEGIVSLVSGEGINIPSVVGPGLSSGSLLGGVVVGGSSAGSGGLSGSSGIGGDVVKVEGLLGGGVGLSTLSSSSVLSLPGIGGGGSSGIAGSGESVGIPGGGLSGLGVGNTSGGGLLSPGTGSGGGLGSGVPGLIGPDGVVEVVVEMSGLVSEVIGVVEVTVEELGLGVGEAVVTVAPAVVAVVIMVGSTEAVAEVTMETVMAVVTVMTVMGEMEGGKIHVLTGSGILALLASLLLSGGSARLSSSLSIGAALTVVATAVLLAHGTASSGSLELHHRGEHFSWCYNNLL